MAENRPILGSPLTGDEERDAIHIPILPVIAGEYIPAGQHIYINSEGWASLSGGTPNAVADSFWPRTINPGERFYAFLFPYTIESLRHEWVHKDFPKQDNTAEVEKSLEWMKVYAENMGEDSWGYEMNVDMLLKGADEWVNNGGYMKWGYDTTYIDDEFWKHYEIIRGVKVPKDKQEDFFSCSC